ncbi:MAG: acyltransferase family protein [Clostridia bacterium]|nr:acyltransferase family protein [Clostridia bacterium]
MFILFMAYALVVLWGMKINLKDKNYFKDYISKDKSTSIKGIFILLVFFSHFNKYASYSGTLDTIYFKIVGLVGQIMVVPFLFYSGYGVMESIKKKGDAYISAIPKNRVLKVFLQFVIATALLIAVKFAVGEEFTLRRIILTLLSWESDWFIFAIICLYIFTYLGFRIIKSEKHLLGVLTVSLLTILYIIILRNFKSRMFYDTVLCYPLGMLYSLYKDKIEKLTGERIYKWMISVIVIGGLATVFKVFGDKTLIPALLGFILAGIFIVILTMRVSLHNKVLNWFGAHLFEVYLLHRIPMIVLEKIGFIKFSPPLSFIVSLTVTAGLSYLYSKMYKKVWALVSGQANK